MRWSTTCRRSTGRAICRDQAKLLEHRQLVKEQIERGMFAISEVEHLDIVDCDPAACRWDVSHQTAENAHMRPGERALLDGNVADEVSGMDVDMRIRKGGEPAAEERCAGLLSVAAYPAWRPEDDIVGEHLREPVNVVGVESRRSLVESFASR